MFEVQACNDAHVGLKATADASSSFYELVIGGWHNRHSAIRREPQGPELKKCSTRNVVDCNKPVLIWVSWENGHIRIGTGCNYGHGVICEWTDNNPYVVNFMSVTTGWGATGQWTIRKFLLMY